MLGLNFNSDFLIEGCDEPARRLATAAVESAGVSVHFDNIDDVLVGLIAEADAVVGAVAWLTNKRLLTALASKTKRVSVIVQKEDFLRPCAGEPPWKSEIKRLYDQIPVGFDRFDYLPKPLRGMSYCGDPTIAGVRCAGQVADRTSGSPRVHHKFAVFAETEVDRSDRDYPHTRVFPYAVATGSYNWTQNATRSRENLVVIRDPKVALAYFNEWAQIAAISEPLNWESEYVQPEWRLGS